MSRDIVLHENLTPRQNQIIGSDSDFMILTGPAGTAKTYTALARGLLLLNRKHVERIAIIRSAVATREIGFLPGSQEEKLAAFTEPYVQIIESLCPRTRYREFVSKKKIEFHSTSFLRGLTFDGTYCIVDEYQNLSAHELETAITRVGVGTHLILCGDSDQSDLQGRDADEHKSVIRTLRKMKDFEIHEFTVDEIVRSDFVRRYYEAKLELN